MLSLPSVFCCDGSKTLNALKATVESKEGEEENMQCRPHSSVLCFPILWQSHVMQTFANVLVITLQVRIFTGLDRNKLKVLIKTSRSTFLHEFQSHIFIHLSCICFLTFDTFFGHK